MADPERKPEIHSEAFEVRPPADSTDFYEKVRDLAYAYDWSAPTHKCEKGKAVLSETNLNGQIFDSEASYVQAWRESYFNTQFTKYSFETTAQILPRLPDELAFYSEDDVKKIKSILGEAGTQAFVRSPDWQQIVVNKKDNTSTSDSEFTVFADFGYKGRAVIEKEIRKRISGEKDLSKREMEEKIKIEVAKIQPEPIKIYTNDEFRGHSSQNVTLDETTLAENIKFYATVYTEVFKAIHEMRGIKTPERKIFFNFQSQPKKVKISEVEQGRQEIQYVAIPELTKNHPDWEGFEAIAGQDEAVKEAKKLVQGIKNPELFLKRGVQIPKGILLAGPPGTGKTLLAKAIAKESGANFIEVSGADINGKWFGESEQRMQSLFDQAKSGGRTILFFDEFDSLASPRDEAWEGSKKVLAIFNQNMSGIHESSNVTVIAATNRIEGIDEAAKRSGRFDKIIQMGLPDEKGRIEILKKHMEKAIKRSTDSGVLFSPNLDFDKITRDTNGMSGADLANLVNRVLESKLTQELDGKAWTPVSTNDILDITYQLSIERSQKVELDFSKKK